MRTLLPRGSISCGRSCRGPPRRGLAGAALRLRPRWCGRDDLEAAEEEVLHLGGEPVGRDLAVRAEPLVDPEHHAGEGKGGHPWLDPADAALPHRLVEGGFGEVDVALLAGVELPGGGGGERLRRAVEGGGPL